MAVSIVSSETGFEDADRAPVSPLGPIKVAVTVDDMLLLRGWPHGPGHDPVSTARAFVSALANHDLGGVFQFSNTAQLEERPELHRCFDIWVEHGHYVGNHTHRHPPLNFMEVADFVEEIETAETHLKPYLEASPHRAFRFCGDLWGDTPCKCGEILAELRRLDYRPIPVSVGFDDAKWSSAYVRTLKRGTADEAAWLRNAYIDSALHELRLAAANARAVFGRDPVHIWLIHGSSIAADCLDPLLTRFRERGVEFVSLDEAMADPMNHRVPPLVTDEFMFQVQKWGLASGVPMNFPHPEILDRIETLHPAAGEMAEDMFRDMLVSMLEHAKMQLPAAD